MSDPAATVSAVSAASSDIHNLIEIAKTGGPYTVILVLVYAVRHLYQARERDREKHDADKQALNDRVVKVIEAQNSALSLAVANQQRQNDALAQTMTNQHALIEAVRRR